ncbi:sporulation initiation factor Spo0A C-terminal domain-containing protein [Bariatricus sp. SGI.154]|uniref:sporulation initiation factor Spo0A C-terminal domain-containing protein n=1 Tax=Bariatricus sp. SGI.154 TaxID=3420549 RepID=UPI003CFBF4B6
MEKIKRLIFSLGIRSTYQGFHYLCYALMLCLQDENYLLSVYKYLYTDVAEHFNVSRDSVDHCLRTVVSACWYRGNRDLLIKLSGYNLTQKPTNGEFIDILYQALVST